MAKPQPDYTAQLAVLREHLHGALNPPNQGQYNDQRCLFYVNGRVPRWQPIRANPKAARIAALRYLTNALYNEYGWQSIGHLYDAGNLTAYHAARSQRATTWDTLAGKPVKAFLAELEAAGVVEYRLLNGQQVNGIVTNG